MQNKLWVQRIVSFSVAIFVTGCTVFAIWRIDIQYIVLGGFSSLAAWWILRGVFEYERELDLDAYLMGEVVAKTKTRSSAYGGGR